MWIGTLVLWGEVALLLLGVVGFRLRRFISRSAVVSAIAVVGCALIASAATIVTAQYNTQLCFYSDAHYTPELGADWTHAVAEATTQANVTLGITGALLLIATILTARVLILGWRDWRRGHAVPI